MFPFEKFQKNPEGETGGVEGPSLAVVSHFLDLIFKPVDPALRARIWAFGRRLRAC